MLRIEHLTKHYSGTGKGITDLSLHIEPGDLFAFIGHNGAGKSTTLKAVAGIHDFEKGRIYIDGTELRSDPLDCRQKLAYIPDSPDLCDYLTGMQYLEFVCDIFRIGVEVRRERIGQYAALFGMTDALGELIGSYSHGMKQKLALIGGLIHKPKLLILDEPFVGLDPEAIFTLKGLMKEHCRNGGAVFFSTHVLDVAEKLCSKVAIVRDGRLVSVGKMEKIVKPGQTLESIFLEVEGHAENASGAGM